MAGEPFAAGVNTPRDLANQLRELRCRQARKRGESELTYRELAARTGWSMGIISAYFSGRTLPSAGRFDVLLALLDATPAERAVLAAVRDRVRDGGRRPAEPTPIGTWRLPADGFRFAGRTAQLAELDALPDITVTTGVVTVVSGTAGVGKTALAVHWAHRMAQRFPDGQLYVNLRGFDPAGSPMSSLEAVRGFLDALGVAAHRIPPSATAQVNLYLRLLAGRRVLVILDNAHSVEQIRPLVPDSPGCLTVVTSRAQLSNLDGAHTLVLDLLTAGQARFMLARRLGFARVAAEPSGVDEIIDRCAGLPLALAIVAARAGTRPLALLAGELRAAEGVPSADTAVHAALSWSYRQLSPAAATLFRRLGTHPDPDVAAPDVAGLTGVAPPLVRPALAELTGADLITEPVPGRYALHDLLRAYAADLDTAR